MRKHFDKFVSVLLAGVSLIFVISLLVFLFNSNLALDANNTVVKALFIVFASVFAGLTILSIYTTFSDKERVNQVLLSSNNGGGVRKASVAVVKKLAREAVANVAGAKLGAVSVFADDNGEPNLKASVIIAQKNGSRVKLDKVSIMLERVTATLELAFEDILGLKFKNIELKLVSAKNYKPPSVEMATIKAIGNKVELERVMPDITPQYNKNSHNFHPDYKDYNPLPYNFELPNDALVVGNVSNIEDNVEPYNLEPSFEEFEQREFETENQAIEKQLQESLEKLENLEELEQLNTLDNIVISPLPPQQEYTFETAEDTAGE